MEALAALADPVRRELVDLLAGGELAAGELARRFPVSRPAISRHLRVLREAGLVTARTGGRRRLFALDARPPRGVGEGVGAHRGPWGPRPGGLGTRSAPRPGGRGGGGR